MSDRFHQITMEQLTDWVFTELEDERLDLWHPTFIVLRAIGR